tara:strand:+ start:930 stop:1418 length:489 start_codon:yes stop_codon:yes gene_type:complete
MLDSGGDVVRYGLVTEITPLIADSIVSLGHLAHVESSFSRLEFSAEKLLDVAAHNVLDPNRVIILAYSGDVAVGVFVGNVASYYFGPALIATDTVWYVIPEKRGTRIGVDLLGYFEDWARSKGASDIRIGQTSTITPEVFEGLLSKRGYRFVGTNYRMETEL